MTVTIHRGANRTRAEAAAGEKLIGVLERAGVAWYAPCVFVVKQA